MSLHDEIATLFAELSRGETDGEDPLEYYGIHTVERWQEYEAERSEWLERDPGARARRVEQWRKANAVRMCLERWRHLDEADRERLAEAIRSGDVGDEVIDEERSNARRHRRIVSRGLHLSNAERLRLADDIRSGRMDVEELRKETGVGITTAGAIGQLDLLEGVA